MHLDPIDLTRRELLRTGGAGIGGTGSPTESPVGGAALFCSFS